MEAKYYLLNLLFLFVLELRNKFKYRLKIVQQTLLHISELEKYFMLQLDLFAG